MLIFPLPEKHVCCLSAFSPRSIYIFKIRIESAERKIFN